MSSYKSGKPRLQSICYYLHAQCIVLDCVSPDRPQKPKLVSFQQGPFYLICVHAAQFDRLGGGHLAVVTQVQIWHKSERRIFLFV